MGGAAVAPCIPFRVQGLPGLLEGVPTTTFTSDQKPDLPIVCSCPLSRLESHALHLRPCSLPQGLCSCCFLCLGFAPASSSSSLGKATQTGPGGSPPCPHSPGKHTSAGSFSICHPRGSKDRIGLAHAEHRAWPTAAERTRGYSFTHPVSPPGSGRPPSTQCQLWGTLSSTLCQSGVPHKQAQRRCALTDCTSGRGWHTPASVLLTPATGASSPGDLTHLP